MISRDSPFRRLPIDLPRRQILYFDALRLSAEMAELAFHRLSELLVRISEKDEEPLSNKAISGLTDAYTVIDSTHRFREVLRLTPGIKHNAKFKLFMRQTQDVEKLRHVVQHLNQEVDRIAQEGWAALGTITWLGSSEVLGGPPTAWILQAGTSYSGQLTYGPMIDTWSSLTSGEIDDISIVTAGVKVNLSKLMHHLRSMVRSLEVPLEQFGAGKEHFGSDTVFSFSLVPLKEDSYQNASSKEEEASEADAS